MLLDVKLGAGAFLLAGRRLLAGHGQDHAYDHGTVVRARGADGKQRSQSDSANRDFQHQRLSSRSALAGLLLGVCPDASLPSTETKERPWAYAKLAIRG